jgi:hypothetical protein
MNSFRTLNWIAPAFPFSKFHTFVTMGWQQESESTMVWWHQMLDIHIMLHEPNQMVQKLIGTDIQIRALSSSIDVSTRVGCPVTEFLHSSLFFHKHSFCKCVCFSPTSFFYAVNFQLSGMYAEWSLPLAWKSLSQEHSVRWNQHVCTLTSVGGNIPRQDSKMMAEIFLIQILLKNDKFN